MVRSARPECWHRRNHGLAPRWNSLEYPTNSSDGRPLFLRLPQFGREIHGCPPWPPIPAARDTSDRPSLKGSGSFYKCTFAFNRLFIGSRMRNPNGRRWSGGWKNLPDPLIHAWTSLPDQLFGFAKARRRTFVSRTTRTRSLTAWPFACEALPNRQGRTRTYALMPF